MLDTNIPLIQMLRSLNTAVAAVDCTTRNIAFENAKFFQWFPTTGNPNAPLDARVMGLDLNAAIKRIENGRTYRIESEIKSGARTIVVSIEARPLNIDRGGNNSEIRAEPLMMLECRDISKQ